MAKLTVTKLPSSNVLIIKQSEGYDFFLSSENSLVIQVSMFAFLTKFLIDNNFVSHKVLEGILEEYHSSEKKGDFDVDSG